MIRAPRPDFVVDLTGQRWLSDRDPALRGATEVVDVAARQVRAAPWLLLTTLGLGFVAGWLARGC